MNPDHHCKKCSPTVGVVVIGRNEEANIEKTLRAIMAQTLTPSQVVFVNDGSTDNTRNIAASIPGVTVLDYPKKHESWVIKKELARVVNFGLIELAPDLDYAICVGSDEVLPPNHFHYITLKMAIDNLMIASGKIKGEYSTIPRGSGRIVDWKWWLEINGGMYPVNYGFESWMIGRCKAMGLKFDIFPEIESYVQRPTGTNYKGRIFIHRGQAYRALGYNRRFVLIRSALMTIKYHDPMAGIQMLRGFMDKDVDPYEQEVRDYYRELQDRQTSIFNIRDLINRYREL